MPYALDTHLYLREVNNSVIKIKLSRDINKIHQPMLVKVPTKDF